MSARRFHFVRETARAQWYVGPVLHASMMLLAIGFGLFVGTPTAWAMCALYVAFWVWHWWKQRRQEAAFWNSRRDLIVWLDEGRLWVSSPGSDPPESEKLDWVHTIDAVVERGVLVRLLVDDREGRRKIYAGFDDMEAFTAEFRRHAPKARFRRVRLGFPMRLKEI